MIRRSNLLSILVALCIAAGSFNVAAAPMRALVIRHVSAFDGENLIRRATVVVRDGRIVSVGQRARTPGDAEVVNAAGMTLLPGLIDAHTHETDGRPPLRQALVLGVTTDLEMFTVDPQFPARMRREQAEGKASDRADLFSSGIGVTAPGGHGTEFGVPVPTITEPGDAQAFVDARIAEGSDYIKIISERGTARDPFNNLSADTLRAVIAAAKRRGKLAVVHVSEQGSALEAIEAGADGLAHVYWVGRPDEELALLAKKRGVFVIPTLTVIQSLKGVPSGAALAADERVAPFLLPDQRDNLGKASRNPTIGPEDSYAVARDTVRLLHKVGVTILAGSDCPNTGTAQGASLHRELELLVEAGLTPIEALRAATSAPADTFHLKDRGRLRPGLRADLLLVRGDPTQDISATRDIVGVWKEGLAVDREAYRTELHAGTTP
ncbi:MAG TPA: amidohydrolase family protein [Verrucomicrobiae bacterium]|nr:amidohydrolase family protein [Verrucomicrobiae bacterium]